MAHGLMAHGAAGSWATLRPLDTGSHTAAHEGPHRLWVGEPRCPSTTSSTGSSDSTAASPRG